MSQQGDRLEVGGTIPAGTIVLLTSGVYSDYGVSGIFRATEDTVIPGRPNPYSWRRNPVDPVPDLGKLSVMLEEINYQEVWSE